MYRIKLNNVNDKYDYNELVKIFLQPDQYELYGEGETLAFESNDIFIEINHQNSEDKNHIKIGYVLLEKPSGAKCSRVHKSANLKDKMLICATK